MEKNLHYGPNAPASSFKLKIGSAKQNDQRVQTTSLTEIEHSGTPGEKLGGDVLLRESMKSAVNDRAGSEWPNCEGPYHERTKKQPALAVAPLIKCSATV